MPSLSKDPLITNHQYWNILELCYEFDLTHDVDTAARIAAIASQQEKPHVSQQEEQAKPSLDNSDRPYIPKFNLFEPVHSAAAGLVDLHVEQRDERFEPASTTTNQLRSRGLASEFHLQLSDLQAVFNGSRTDITKLMQRFFRKQDDGASLPQLLSQDPALFNYAHSQKWNNEQQLDLLNQLWGGKERIVLTKDVCVAELRALVRLQQSKAAEGNTEPSKNNQVEDETHVDMVKKRYLLFLRALDTVVCTMLGERGDCTLPLGIESYIVANDRIPLSYECIGHLCSCYFVPWIAQTHADSVQSLQTYMASVVLPWQLLSKDGQHLDEANLRSMYVKGDKTLQHVIKSHYNMYKHRENRFLGMQQFSSSRDLVEQEKISIQIAEMEKIVGKKQQFYANERLRFLEGESYARQASALIDAIQRYKTRQDIQRRLLDFCAMHKGRTDGQ